MDAIEIFIAGTPAPGGSKTAFPRRYGDKSLIINGMTIRGGKVWGMPVMNMGDAGGKRNKAWKKVVRATAKKHLRGKGPLAGALSVQFTFLMPRPKAHFRTGRNAHLLKDAAPKVHTQKPDLRKLIRSTEDAMSGTVWEDDAQIVEDPGSMKRWAKPGEEPGCRVIVRAFKAVDADDNDEPFRLESA